MASVQRRPAEHVWPILSYGFRPFFLLGALYGAAAILLWLPLFYGDYALPTAFSPLDWHAHELLYGFVPAIITGFLLTAVPNWTGRLPLAGTPLLVLVLVWIAGRVAIDTSAQMGGLVAAVIDSSFLWLTAAAVAREIVAGRNWRNLKVLLPLSLLACGNIGFHVEALTQGAADVSIRVGVASVVLLIMLIGGRIVPSFTRNWLAHENPGRLPIAFNRFDAITIAISVAVLVLWIASPESEATGALALLSAALQFTRVVRWAGDRTLRNPLVLILHLAYVFVPIGFALTGLAALRFVSISTGIHAWMAGGAGSMTLAIMTRASLGHTGRKLAASAATQAIYASILAAGCLRIASAGLSDRIGWLLIAAGAAWIFAFLGFAVSYGPLLFRRTA